MKNAKNHDGPERVAGVFMPAAMSFHPLTSSDDFERALDASREQPVVVFKHSLSCPISAAAQAAFNRLPDEAPIYRLVVQESRSLSGEIARKLDVAHETPQAIILEDGSVRTHASHYRISTEWLRNELALT